MKKLLLLFFALIAFLNNNAQTNVYYPFPDTNVAWNQYSWFVNNNTSTYYTTNEIYFLAGDTIISSFHYKKILNSGYNSSSTYPFDTSYFSNIYVGAIRQDSIHKKVYYRTNSSTSVDTLLYNFNLSVGDTLPSSYINNYNLRNYVSAIDSILVGTSYRKQYHISINSPFYAPSSNYVQLIEGIGSTFGLIPVGGIIPPSEFGGTLNCFSQNNRVIYVNHSGGGGSGGCDSTLSINQFENNNQVNIYPNPTSNNFIIETTYTDKQTLQLFDVNGKLVLTQTINGKTNIDASNLAEGVYNLSLINAIGVVNKRLVIVR